MSGLSTAVVVLVLVTIGLIWWVREMIKIYKEGKEAYEEEERRETDFSAYKVCGYRDDVNDIHQWLKYCRRGKPIPYEAWYRLTIDWQNGDTEENPYTDEEKEKGMIAEIERTLRGLFLTGPTRRGTSRWTQY